MDHGEKLSAYKSAAGAIVSEFPQLIKDNTLDEMFSSNENGLNFRKNAWKTLMISSECRDEGRKLSKSRVTINACANVTWSIKLTLLLVGMSKRPQFSEKS